MKKYFCLVAFLIISNLQAATSNVKGKDVARSERSIISDFVDKIIEKFQGEGKDVVRPNQRLLLCEGAKAMMKCPFEYQKIKVVRALYGREKGNYCARPPSTSSVTNCRSPVSESKVKQLCEGKSKCSLAALNGVFGDPCGGIYKYLEVEYKCLGKKKVKSAKEFVLCEHDTGEKRKKRLHCRSSYQKINIFYAMYGRTSTKTCPKGPRSFTGCFNPFSLEKAKALCDGKTECTLEASNTVFGDPCGGTSKYLEVKYMCSGYLAVDGGWSNWSLFSKCSKPCGLGVMVRRRQCTNPHPSGSGKTCDGRMSEKEEMVCIKRSCKK